jgi:hypothetical protein
VLRFQCSEFRLDGLHRRVVLGDQLDELAGVALDLVEGGALRTRVLLRRASGKK